jgi:enterochelin esterase-like enzyme
MGGAGAAALAFTHPALFGAVGIHSPALFTDERLGPPWIFGLGDPAAFAGRDPVHLVRRLPRDCGLRIYLDCGLDDEMTEAVADLHYTLIEHGTPHTYLSRKGGHNEAYWSTHLAEYLGFYAAGW